MRDPSRRFTPRDRRPPSVTKRWFRIRISVISSLGSDRSLREERQRTSNAMETVQLSQNHPRGRAMDENQRRVTRSERSHSCPHLPSDHCFSDTSPRCKTPLRMHHPIQPPLLLAVLPTLTLLLPPPLLPLPLLLQPPLPLSVLIVQCYPTPLVV